MLSGKELEKLKMMRRNALNRLELFEETRDYVGINIENSRIEAINAVLSLDAGIKFEEQRTDSSYRMESIIELLIKVCYLNEK